LKDLVSIAHKGYSQGMAKDEISNLISGEIHQTLKQMPEEEFRSHIASASIDREATEYTVILKFQITTDEV